MIVMAFFTMMFNLDEDHVMVSFTCPIAWAMEWPDIWTRYLVKLILSVSVKMFLEEINI